MVGLDLWFGYLLGGPVSLIAVIVPGHWLRSIIRPFNLSLYYDPRSPRPPTMFCAYGASRGDPCTIS